MRRGIYKADVSDTDHVLCEIIGEIQGAKFPTHSLIIRFSDEHPDGRTLEARAEGVVERDWLEYVADPSMHIAMFEWSGADPIQLEAAFYLLRRRTLGKRYPFGQFLATGAWLLAKRIGWHWHLPRTKLNVCSELLWRMIDLGGGEHAEALRREYPRKDEYLPLTDCAWSMSRPDLWRRVNP